MPLIDLQTNLKNLRFGNDRPGYGSSGLPYIQTIMPDTPNATGNTQPIYKPGQTGGLDFPIRGGQLEFNLGSQSFTVSSKIDKSRIKKFFEDKQRGTTFIQKQVGLQLSNPKIETGNTLFGIPQGIPIPGLIENTRVYNLGQNTLAQVGVSGTGFHAIRHGLVPFNPYQKQYYDIVNNQNIDNRKSTNRLYNLMLLKMTTGDPFVNAANVPDINLVNTLGISLNRNMIFQYLGGPSSVYGIGTTTIPRVVDTTKLRSFTSMTYDSLMKQNTNLSTTNINGDYIRGTKIQDFREQLSALDGSYQPWGNNTIDSRFYTYNVVGYQYKDKMNLLYPFLFKNSQAPWEVTEYKDSTQDLIKFAFEAVSNDQPTYSTAIFFRALLIGSITDNNQAELNSFKYVGRGENFYTYQGFNRSIGFSFRVAAQSEAELKPMYNRINMLMSQVYPDYSPNQGIMRAPLVRVTIGDYLYRVPGFLESVNLTIDNTNTPWEINLQNDQTGNIAQLPQMVDINVTFRPILDVLPKRPNTSVQGQTTVNAQTEQSQDTQTIISNVTPLIANVPQAKGSPTTFIKPTVQGQFSSTREATLRELASVDQSLAADIASAEEDVIQRNPYRTRTGQGDRFTQNIEGLNLQNSLLTGG